MNIHGIWLSRLFSSGFLTNYQKLSDNFPKKIKMTTDILSVLLKCRFFVTLSKEQINPIISLCHTEQYQPGKAIFNQWNQGNKTCVTKEGQVSLERSVDWGDRNAQVNIAFRTRKSLRIVMNAFGRISLPHVFSTMHLKNRAYCYWGFCFKGWLKKTSQQVLR